MQFDPNGTILAGVSADTLRQWLGDAQAAYAQLMTGSKVVTVSYTQGDGAKSVTYRAADMVRLTAWIGLLQRQLGVGTARRALRPYFR